MTFKRIVLSVLGLAATGVMASSCATSAAPVGGANSNANVYGAFLAARYAGVSRDGDAAAAYYQTALRRDPGNEYLIERAFTSALASGDMATAADLAEPALNVSPADRLARVLLASRELRNNRYERAQSYLVGHDLGAFNRVVGALVLAWAHEGAGETDEALAALDAPEDAPVLGHLMTLHRALILDRAGRADEAELLYMQALESGLLRSVVVDALGRRLEREGRLTEASYLYLNQISENADDAVGVAGLARIERGERPRPFVETPAEGASMAVFGPAATLVGNEHSELAAVYLRLALYLDEDNGAARYLLGDIYTRAGLEEEAHDIFAAAPLGDAYYAPSQIAAAYTLLRRDRSDDAIAALETLASRTDDRAASLALGDAYRADERYADAERVFDDLINGIEGEPEADDWRLYYARAISRERLDRWDEAEADFFRALELSPEQPGVLNYLGYSWVDRGERLEQAFDMIRRAVELQPDAGYIVDSLGWAHYRLGEYEEAVRHLERAVELDPQDPTINDHLGDAYWRAGRRLEASYQWTRTLSLEPDDDLRAELEGKLTAGLPPETEARFASEP